MPTIRKRKREGQRNAHMLQFRFSRNKDTINPCAYPNGRMNDKEQLTVIRLV